MTMSVKLIDDRGLWDNFVVDNPGGLLFHRWTFLTLLEKYSDYQFMPYGIYKGNELICVFPLFHKKLLGQNVFFSPPPQSGIPYMGPVITRNYYTLKQDKKESFLNHTAQEILGELRRFAPRYLQLRLTPAYIDVRSFMQQDCQATPCFTYVLDLKPATEDIWNGFTGVARQNIRKGLENNYVLQRSSDTGKLFEFLSERFQREGKTFVVNPYFLAELQQAFPDEFKIYYLYNEAGEIVSGVLNCEQNAYVLGWLGLPRPKDKKDTCANEVLLWQLLQQKKAEGYQTFEIVEAETPEMCTFRNKLNPKLGITFKINRKGAIGAAGEIAFKLLLKKYDIRPTPKAV